MARIKAPSRPNLPNNGIFGPNRMLAVAVGCPWRRASPTRPGRFAAVIHKRVRDRNVDTFRSASDSDLP